MLRRFLKPGASKKNDELIRLAEADFDIFLTNDQNIEHQQNIISFNLSFIVLVAATNDIDDLRPLMPAANEAMKTIKPGELFISRLLRQTHSLSLPFDSFDTLFFGWYSNRSLASGGRGVFLRMRRCF